MNSGRAPRSVQISWTSRIADGRLLGCGMIAYGGLSKEIRRGFVASSGVRFHKWVSPYERSVLRQDILSPAEYRTFWCYTCR